MASTALKRIIVTGANKGVGLGTVKRLLREYSDTYVLLGARDLGRGQAAVDEAVAEGAAADRISALLLDPCSDESVATAHAQVRSMFPEDSAPLWGIVNNAGMAILTDRVASVEEFSPMLEVNVFAVKRVTDAFLPLIAEGGRIVNIASGGAPTFVGKCSAARIEFFKTPHPWEEITALVSEFNAAIAGATEESWNAKGLGDGSFDHYYSFTKACLTVYTMQVSLEQPQLLVNACSPGFIESDITRPFAAASNKTPAEFGLKTPDQGALCSCFLMMGEPGSGMYFGSDAKRSPPHKYRSPGDPEYTGDDTQEFTGGFIADVAVKK